MKTLALTTRLAEEKRLSPAAAADQLGQMVHDILAQLKEGQEAHLPGLGTLRRGENAQCIFLGDAPAKECPGRRRP